MNEFLLKYTQGGKEVALSEMTDGTLREALRDMWDAITERVGSERCPLHGAAALVICDGIFQRDLRFTVQGCCQYFVETISASLEEFIAPSSPPKPILPPEPEEEAEANPQRVFQTTDSAVRRLSKSTGENSPSKSLPLLLHERGM